MSFTTAANARSLFNVVGPAYGPEGHAEALGHLPARSEVERLETGVTSLWLSLFAAIGISLISNSPLAKAVHFAASSLS